MNRIKIFFNIIIISLITPLVALAQTAPLQKLKDIQPDSGYADANEYNMASNIGVIINTFLGLLGIIFIILMVYSGYLWMTASGDEAKVQKAKDTIWRAIIGLIITVGSYAIWNFVFDYFISK